MGLWLGNHTRVELRDEGEYWRVVLWLILLGQPVVWGTSEPYVVH